MAAAAAVGKDINYKKITDLKNLKNTVSFSLFQADDRFFFLKFKNLF